MLVVLWVSCGLAGLIWPGLAQAGLQGEFRSVPLSRISLGSRVKGSSGQGLGRHTRVVAHPRRAMGGTWDPHIVTSTFHWLSKSRIQGDREVTTTHYGGECWEVHDRGDGVKS